MKCIAVFLMTLIVPVVVEAQEQTDNYFIFGINILMPSTTGEVTGPPEFVEGYAFSTWVRKSSDVLRSRGILGFSLGAHIDKLRTSFIVSATWAQVSSPGGCDSREVEFSCRYSILELGPATLLCIASLKSSTGGRSDASDRSFAGCIMRDQYWIPGVGLGLDLSIIHADVRLHAWTHLRIADAAVPSGPPPAPYDKIPYTMEPVYLKYDVSLNLGIEFPIRPL